MQVVELWYINHMSYKLSLTIGSDELGLRKYNSKIFYKAK